MCCEFDVLFYFSGIIHVTPFPCYPTAAFHACVFSHLLQNKDQPDKNANPARVQLNRENVVPPIPVRA